VINSSDVKAGGDWVQIANSCRS